ncbi:glycine betaine ABC transporter substrate-binding protein [Vreelandella subglaciescola]|uniref:Glycine betaine/proline transport system substrate-binding protein n=1 Tax=Vreelandella subglaciescola TaxID=29571 RepID=A0A1M7FY52_9GAMM|nr:glycine betaine ABC transporter substrate-binding protein [Halomonas subglaciescola]SHM09052.1 glycine betaine/proline transport system substrate-binding protein [Halomonas subglaciescola]
MTTSLLSYRIRAASLALLAGAGLTAGAVQADDQDKGTVKLSYVEWASAVASTNVMKAVLEQAGYNVETSSLSAAVMWQSVASGDTDAFLAGWLPTTHEDYNEKLGDQVDDLGANLDGTKLGLVVPSYVEADSISDLNEYADDFDGQIVGIDPGAGIMRLSENVVDEYDLDLNLQSGSGATMTAALKSAIANEESIAVTGWTPHWMFARWDLKYLDDPKNVYGGAEHINTVARQGLEDDMPEAYAILNAFEWTADDMGEVMLMQEEGNDPYKAAKQWVDEHPDMVNEWLEG